jgi:AraC-like DNA-binding protein
MKYDYFEPCEELNPYIERYYVLEHHDFLFSELEIECQSNCYSGWVLNFGDTYRCQNRNSSTDMTKSMLSGIPTLPYSIFIKGKVFMIGVVFKGIGMNMILDDILLGNVLDQRIEFQSNEAEIIWEALNNADKIPEKLEIIEGYLVQKVRKKISRDNIIQNIALMILKHHGLITIEQLVDTFQLSDRHLRRIFKRATGVSPKLFIRIKRFNYVHFTLTNNKELNWNEFLMKDGGYYDQAHFIKDFTTFSGKAPTAKILQSRQLSALIENN